MAAFQAWKYHGHLEPDDITGFQAWRYHVLKGLKIVRAFQG